MKFIALITIMISSSIFAQSYEYQGLRLRNERQKQVKPKQIKKETKNLSGFELSSAFLTHHFSKLNADRFANKASKDGRTIKNPLYAMSWVSQGKSDTGEITHYSSFSLYGGQDSIGSPMYGFMTSLGFGSTNETGLQVGGIWGLYFYDENAWEEKFHDREAKTPSWLRAYYGESFRGVNMIFGLEVNLQIQISNNFYIKQKNVITPMITISSIGLGWNY